jgi:hypothetical protein
MRTTIKKRSYYSENKYLQRTNKFVKEKKHKEYEK